MHDDIYSAVCHHDQVIARVHSVHLVNVEQRQAVANPQTKPHDLGCESACFRQLASTTTIAIYYYYSAQKLILMCDSRVFLSGQPRLCPLGGVPVSLRIFVPPTCAHSKKETTTKVFTAIKLY